MQLLILGFKDCLLGDKIFKNNQRPEKIKKNPKTTNKKPPTNSQPFIFAAVTGKVSLRFSVLFILEPFRYSCVKAKAPTHN